MPRQAVWQAVEAAVLPWLDDPAIARAIKRQNDAHSELSQQEIERLDAQWREETRSAERPLIDSVLARDLSLFLRRKRSESDGLLTEIFVMDRKGLNVGQSDVTSDYWQGDELKWEKSCLAGPNAVFVDEVTQDESTQRFQSQVSLAIDDAETGLVIGCITVGVDVDRALSGSL